jgi:hypothetical protein
MMQSCGSRMTRTTRTWQAWELGQNPMPIGMWELFHLKLRAQRRAHSILSGKR